MRSTYHLLAATLLLAACGKNTPEPTPSAALEAGTRTEAATVSVSTATQLQNALNTATAGTIISLADGTYTGQFSIPAGRHGTSSSRIIVTGTRLAILQTNSRSSGKAALNLLGNNYWEFRGFSVTNSKKGIMTDNSNNNVFDRLSIRDMGDEGIHFRTNSKYNVLKYSEIKNMGTVTAGYGEGAYIGSAKSNWSTYMGSSTTPDRSDYNRIENNTFGPDVRAEHIDVKEGTTGGTVSGNTFNGAGMSGANYADSWMDVKGNGYTISGNNGNTARLDGFQTHVALTGWGRDNKFSGNTCNVGASGYGFNIQQTSGSANGNIVYANNSVTNAGSGFANITVTP
ncbi:hypothetical protein [Hymenobacter koreensis]|uniref:Right handed beta helix region n=1 Tax=Hymenobacter koreensis TaxID=1084523 RepID=A0ABP8IYX2_9BACT